MRDLSHQSAAQTPELLVLAAAFLHVPARRQRALLRGQERALGEWLAEDSARKVSHARHRAREALHRLHQMHARLVLIDDAAYPAGLRDLHDPPAFLTVRGELPERGIAIVGTRDATPAAEAFAYDLAASLGMPVISGLARGVDAAAHRGALDSQTATLAYVATGAGVTYPPQHKELEEAIVAHGGAIASERVPGEAATPVAFIHRDRLQAAHAAAVILIASEVDGGAMHTMNFAKELNRPRFAVAGGELTFAGNAAVIGAGAAALPASVSEALKVLKRAL